MNHVSPNSVESEQGVLGCCFLDPMTCVPTCITRKIGKKFYDLRHPTIFDAMEGLFEKGRPIEIISVMEWLKDRSQLEGIGGVSYLNGLMDFPPSSDNLGYYLETVERKHYARIIIARAHHLAQEAHKMDDINDFSEVMDKMECAIFALRTDLTQSTNRGDSFSRIVDKVQKATDGDNSHVGLPTGFKSLDTLLGGLEVNTVTIIAARPSVGKSTLAMNFAEYLAIQRQCPVGIFTLEMDEDQLNTRSLAAVSNIDIRKSMKCGLDSHEMDQFARAVSILQSSPIHIHDRSDATISQIRAESRRMVGREGIKLIIIDYIQLITMTSKTHNSSEGLTEISQGIKRMAKELKIPVIALAQLNREFEKDGNRKPRLSDLRGSGSLEADADNVIFLYPKDESDGNGNIVKVMALIAKNRNGYKGEVELHFDKPHSRFFEPKPIVEDDLWK